MNKIRHITGLTIATVFLATHAGDWDKPSAEATEIIRQRKKLIELWEVCLRSNEKTRDSGGQFAFALEFPPVPEPILFEGDQPETVAKPIPIPDWVGGLEKAALDACKSAKSDGSDAFGKLCVRGDAAAKEKLYRELRDGCTYWKVASYGVLRNRKDPNLGAVEIKSDGKYLVKATTFSSDETSIRDYLKMTGLTYKDMFRGVSLGFRKLLFLRFDPKAKVWGIDAKHSDGNLNVLFRKELFYPSLRGIIWNRYLMEKDKIYLNDFSKPFKGKATYFQDNDHFTLTESVALEQEIRIVKRPPTAKKPPFYDQQDYYLIALKPYSFEWFAKGFDWKKKYTKKQMMAFLDQVNRINKEDLPLPVMYGKERIIFLMKKAGLKLFKKPIHIEIDVRSLDKSNIDRRVLLDHVRNTAAQKFFCFKDYKEYSERKRLFERLKMKMGKGKLAKLGMNSLQLHGYQRIKFANMDMTCLFGLYANPNEGDNSKQHMFLLGRVHDKSKKTWLLDEYDTELGMVGYFRRTGLDYEWLLNSVFDRLAVNKTIGMNLSYCNFYVTGKQYHDRLKKLKIYDIFRIRKTEECTVYKKGLDHTKLPTWTLEEIEKAK